MKNKITKWDKMKKYDKPICDVKMKMPDILLESDDNDELWTKNY